MKIHYNEQQFETCNKLNFKFGFCSILKHFLNFTLVESQKAATPTTGLNFTASVHHRSPSVANRFKTHFELYCWWYLLRSVAFSTSCHTAGHHTSPAGYKWLQDVGTRGRYTLNAISEVHVLEKKCAMLLYKYVHLKSASSFIIRVMSAVSLRCSASEMFP